MNEKYVYRCPNQSICKIHKKCNIFTRRKKLPEPFSLLYICKAEKKEIDLKIQPDGFDKN